jgi:hypothetical protein
MRFYTRLHRFYCGVDLHARTTHVCVLDHDGDVVCDKNLPCHPETFLRTVAPFRDRLGVECMFARYWLADLCQEQHIDFVTSLPVYSAVTHPVRRIEAAVPEKNDSLSDHAGVNSADRQCAERDNGVTAPETAAANAVTCPKCRVSGGGCRPGSSEWPSGCR